MRINQPDVMAQIEAEAERQYPFTKRSHKLDLSFVRT
jgi:hypothetical protein